MQHLFYWALIPIIGTVAIAVIVFTFLVYVNWPSSSALPRETRQLNLRPYSASSFKFSKELGLPRTIESEREDGVECVVCLLGFEDDEVIRQLHRCKHSFHAPCIDMWMYSHSNCPICRTSVDKRARVDDLMSDDNSSCMETEGAPTDVNIT
ncbi:F-box associated ubiquitination effector family protein [Hibiscus syriacus]|uniref:F-box associated ubiquitination effector family protein n=1 Tax=Hibiscus syriacus TaxID=106335 RepID=A0A6A3AG94_HIBSY|nr:E3 ubiquitin-protein ligase EL5-like [Hibiscus syriacus]KAE8703126.1 F-box associated ubiquitination effector family protein [Hibiscus syriacus]